MNTQALKNIVKDAVPALAAKLEKLNKTPGLTDAQKAQQASQTAVTLLQKELKTAQKGGNPTKKNTPGKKKGKFLSIASIAVSGASGAGIALAKNYGQSMYMQTEFAGTEEDYNQTAYNMLWGAIIGMATQAAYETGLNQKGYRFINSLVNISGLRRVSNFRFATPNNKNNNGTRKKNKNQNEPGSPVNDPRPPNNIRINMPRTPPAGSE